MARSPKTYQTLRLILGDQLNPQHSWFKVKDPSVLYVIAELHDEAGYVKHHIQKIAAFFLAMENFATSLKKAGHNVLHMTLDDTETFKDTTTLIDHLIKQYGVQNFEYQRPDEYRLTISLSSIQCEQTHCVDTEHFLLPFEEIPQHFKANKAHRMEAFYRKMRKRYGYLLNDRDEPIGGQWNFDQDNRKALSKEDLTAIPEPVTFKNSVQSILTRLSNHGIATMGNVDNAKIQLPVSRAQARKQLAYFCQSLLHHFGDFQDAMTCQSPHGVFLYHSGLSFALNTKMISPKEVIETVIKQLHSNLDNLSQIEGFVRQILGWREFVRGIYWANMPDYQNKNALQHHVTLPHYFWDGDTQMNCMKHALSHSLNHSYAHHIERLMVIGNFCLLTGIHPDEVDQWYLGVYADAIEWVQLPNTRGMSQFADGGLLASKPYISSGQYINKMSDYCQSCTYKVKEKVGPKACPFNSLYWHFLDTHKDRFQSNPRLKFAYTNWNKRSTQEKSALRKQAVFYKESLGQL